MTAGASASAALKPFKAHVHWLFWRSQGATTGMTARGAQTVTSRLLPFTVMVIKTQVVLVGPYTSPLTPLLRGGFQPEKSLPKVPMPVGCAKISESETVAQTIGSISPGVFCWLTHTQQLVV